VFSAAQFAQKSGLTIGGVLPIAALSCLGYETNTAQAEISLMGICLVYTCWLTCMGMEAGIPPPDCYTTWANRRSRVLVE
jgi:Na+/melibiose symporter-like transporter